MIQQLRIFDIKDDWKAIISAVDEDGGAIVRNFISRELRDCLASELQLIAEKWTPGRPGEDFAAELAGARTKRFTGLAAKAPRFAEVIDHDLLHEWARQGMRTDYWMNTGLAIIVGPGSTDQPLHRDQGLWPIAEMHGRDGPEAMQSIMLAISDFTQENGATRVVPGSHRWLDYSQEAAPDQVVQAVMPAGSALLYSGKVLHGSGANRTSNEWRFGIHLSFCRADLRPEEANCLTVPWSSAQNFSERVKYMLGFYSGRPILASTPTTWMADGYELRHKFSPPPSENYAPSGPDSTTNSGADAARMVEVELARR